MDTNYTFILKRPLKGTLSFLSALPYESLPALSKAHAVSGSLEENRNVKQFLQALRELYIKRPPLIIFT